MTTWITLAGAGLAIYALRSLLLLAHRLRPPAAFERGLVYVAPAALAALAAPALVAAGGSVPAIAPRAAALALAVVVAQRSRSIGATVATGMAVLWVATAVCTALS